MLYVYLVIIILEYVDEYEKYLYIPFAERVMTHIKKTVGTMEILYSQIPQSRY
jgi:hypothetical protein